jgi:hypothetical protein
LNSFLAAAIVFACLFGAVLLGMGLRRLLPEHHLSADTKDTVKLAMGLVATMAALLLGLLVSSAKGAYDAERIQVIQMAAKVVFLDRVLTDYGPEAADIRIQLHALVEEAVQRMWPEERNIPPQLASNTPAGDAIYSAIQQLSPRNDLQRSLKAQAATLAVEAGQLRTLLIAQLVPSISKPLLIVVVSWLVAIFLSFSLFAPPNATANLALMVAVLAVSGAIYLILELDQPFGGLIQISSEPMLNALSHLAK